MNEPNQNEILLRVGSVLNGSLPRYMQDTGFWYRKGDDDAIAVIEQISADQGEMIERISQYVMESETAVQLGGYPMEFTGYHDLSLEYLLTKLIEHQQRDTRLFALYVEQLSTAPMAKALAEEALGMSKGHLELLEEIAGKHRGAAA